MDQILKCGNAEEAWYCARTQPKHEHIAAANITKQLGLAVFQPRLQLERSTRRGVVRVIEPVFPCYLFVRCQLEEYVDGIRHVSGISSLVHFGQRIPSVPDEVIEELQQCFDSGEPIAVNNHLRPGMEVSVSDGAFLGSHGLVVRIFPAKQRVQILLDFLGRTTLAEVDRKCLRAEDMSVAQFVPALAVRSQGILAAAV
jgi:transcriptional antiterminator RfaH